MCPLGSSDVRKKATGEDIENDKDKKLNTSSKAFKLFLDKKTLVDVAISLDLPTEEVLKNTKKGTNCS